MLGAIRKFSSSIYAKIFLVIVIMPFIFWGMGPVFQGGKKNVVFEIGNEKTSTKEFIDYIKYNNASNSLDKKDIERLLSDFIREKIIKLESEDLNIQVSNNSLASIIKNEKIFIKNNKFSRTEYEKFLVKNSLNAATFERNIEKQIRTEQLFDFIGGGAMPSEFFINEVYNNVNKKMSVELINLNDILRQKEKFTSSQIKKYYDENKDSFKDTFKLIKFLELNAQNLTESNEVTDLFFQKIDEIDDLIVAGENLNFILKKFNLDNTNTINFNQLGYNKNGKEIINFPKKLINNIFAFSDFDAITLQEYENKYYIVEVIETENIQRKADDVSVNKEIVSKLKGINKRKFITGIIAKINEGNFKKNDFDSLSIKENASINKIKLNNLNDDKFLKKNLVEQVYLYPEKQIIVVADIGLVESYLVYIDKVENVKISKDDDDYQKYYGLSKIRMANNLYNTYDIYLENKYEIKINYKALDNIKNYF